MALARVKTWNAAETLTASDLNAEFNNICNHFGALTNADIDSTASYVMGELVVGSGITSADGGQLHVHTATAGTIQASGDADEAVFENSGASGITILSGATSTGNIAFGDSGDADNGLLKYTHGATPTLGVTVNATAVQSIAAAATTLAHDFEIYQDVNNADSAIRLGTSATEALFVEALNGGSNKTLEELRLTTKTASGTANHGKISFYVDEVNIGNINDAGITLESGKIFAGNITGNVTGNTSGTAATVTGGTQAAITSCANLVTVGTVGTGVWQGTAVASAYLDADTAHLSTTQTFTGDKTFTGTVTVGVDDTGKDVKFFGASAGAYLEWDQSEDQLRILGPSADAAGSSGKLLLATAQTSVESGDILGQIDFQAPLETGTDAIVVSASVKAVAQGTFAANVNATDLIFYTAHDAAVAERFRFTSQGEIGIAGANYGTDGQVLTSAGAGAAAAWEALPSSGISWDGSTPNGVATFKDSDEATVEANLTFDGTTLNVVGNAGVGIARTDGTLHVHTATCGTETANALGNILVLEDDDNNGMSILVPDASYGQILWGSPSGDGTGDANARIAAGYNSGSQRLDISVGSTNNIFTVNDGGSCNFVGAVTKASGSFRIKHPLESRDGYDLVHSFIEGPQADLLYRGTATLSGGTATVNIDTAARITDGTFVALVNNVQAFTSNETGFDAVRGSVSGNVLTITSADDSSTASISWLVAGERKDAHMLDTDWTDSDGRVITEPETVAPLELEVA